MPPTPNLPQVPLPPDAPVGGAATATKDLEGANDQGVSEESEGKVDGQDIQGESEGEIAEEPNDEQPEVPSPSDPQEDVSTESMAVTSPLPGVKLSPKGIVFTEGQAPPAPSKEDVLSGEFSLGRPEVAKGGAPPPPIGSLMLTSPLAGEQEAKKAELLQEAEEDMKAADEAVAEREVPTANGEAAGPDCKTAKWHLSPKKGKCSNSASDFPQVWLRTPETAAQYFFDDLAYCCRKFFSKDACDAIDVCPNDGGESEPKAMASNAAVVLMAEGEDAPSDEEKDISHEKDGEEEAANDGDEGGGDEEGAKQDKEGKDDMEEMKSFFEEGNGEDTSEPSENEVEGDNSAPKADADEEQEQEQEQDAPDEDAEENVDEQAPPEEDVPQGSASTEGQGGELEEKSDWKGFHEDKQKINIPESNDRDHHAKAHDISEATGNQGYEGDGFRFHVLRPKGQGSGKSASLGVAGILLAAFLVCYCYCRQRRRSKTHASHRGKYSALHGNDDFFDGTFSDDISFGGKSSDDEGSFGSYGSDEEYGNGAGATLEMGGIHESDANGGLTLREING
ncbi:hypothetical protein ACHAXT_012314 [Thalassiosira profunda]